MGGDRWDPRAQGMGLEAALRKEEGLKGTGSGTARCVCGTRTLERMGAPSKRAARRSLG